MPFRRMEGEPGAEVQVDFGPGAPVVIPEGEALPVGVKTRRGRTHIFRIVLSHSRKAYREGVYRQTTEDFIRGLEHAFGHVGGVPRTRVVDPLKAAVIPADGYDPDLNPKIRSFCESAARPVESPWRQARFAVANTTARGSCRPGRPRRVTRARSSGSWVMRRTRP